MNLSLGVSSNSWESSANGKWKSDPNAFIFSLINGDKWPLKMRINSNRHKYAINCTSSSRFGPRFGIDICKAYNANINLASYSNLGKSYNHPQYAFGINGASTFLAGSNSSKSIIRNVR